MTLPEQRTNLLIFVSLLKNFPLTLTKPRPLKESISSSGGVPWNELNEALMLKKFSNVYCAGEMIDWDAPTGGFLIQACVAQGAWVARNILKSQSHQNKETDATLF
jgi:predicted flavoprotein YhiN